MSLRSFAKKTISEFRGAWTVRDQTRQTAQRASLAYNVRFFPGMVFTRPGTSAGLTLGVGAISSFFSWIIQTFAVDVLYGTPAYFIVYLEQPNIVRVYNQNIPANILLYNRSGVAGLSVVEAEQRAYIGHYDVNGSAVGTMKIVDMSLSGTPADDAFMDPLGTVPVISDAGVGFCTAGPHNFAYRVISRTGFPGQPSPLVGGVFTPATFTVAPGGRALHFVINLPSVPNDAGDIQLCMTTTDNLDQYFDIPGALQALAGSPTPVAINMTVSISDEDLVLLAGTPSEITDNFSYLTKSTGAPNPSRVAKLGNRNCYVAGTTVFISDPYELQVLRQPDNAIQGPGIRTIMTVHETTNGQLAIFGVDWTAVLGGDNSRRPRQWAPPASVSETIGAPGTGCVCASAGRQFLWVAHQSGLYTFNGTYGQIPVSFMFSPDWNRINWTAAQTIQMVDDAAARCLKINVPLDGATKPNHRMVIDYSRARQNYWSIIDEMAVDYSLDDVNNASEVDSVGMVLNSTNGLREFWMGLSNGTLIREDATVKTDLVAPVGIHTLWETGQVLSVSEMRLLLSRFGGAHLDVRGSGQLMITPYSLGRQATSDDPVDPVQLELTPDGMEESRWHMQSENQTIRMETTGTGDWFELRELWAYYRPAGSTKAS